MSASEIDRTLVRLAHEILEKNSDLDRLAFIGIRRRGVPLAQRLARKIESLEQHAVPVGILDINLYRDDLTTVDIKPVVSATEIPFSVQGKDIILMDDVLYTGRTIRAALDALFDHGRPARVHLLVLIDRGHRELPIEAQFVGRTVQMWNRYRQTAQFRDGKRWLLRFFDQLRFYPVSAEELLRLRADFPYGKASLRIEPATLRLRDYRQFLAANAGSIAAFKARQQAAFDAERERWRSGAREDDDNAELPVDGAAAATTRINAVPAGCIAISSPVTGSVWQLHTQVGARAEAGAPLIVIEAMKMEIAVQAEQPGTVVELCCQRGQPVSAGETLLILRI